MNDNELEEIVRVENSRPTGYVYTIYKKPNGDFIKKGEYMDQVQWIEMGHGAEFHNNEIDWLFQKVFHVSEAIEYGFKVPCDYDKYIDPYKGLTCDPTELFLLEEISAEGYGGGDYRLNELFECPTCRQVWRINKIMDSHRGMTINCFKSSRTV